MRRIILVLLMLCAALHAVPVEELQSLEFKQYPGRLLPLDTQLTDEKGSNVRLEDYFSGKPVLIVPGYFRCQMLCSGLSDGMLRALQAIRKSAGPDFRVVFVSIDPDETAAKASERRSVWGQRYGRLGAENGAAFLRGRQEEVAAFASRIGFEYRYDPLTAEFAHPAGFIIATPEGKIHRYFFGVSFSTAELENAIDEAARGKTGSIIKEFILLCFHYNPVRSPYSEGVMMVVRILALGTLAGLGIAIIRSGRKRKEAQ